MKKKGTKEKETIQKPKRKKEKKQFFSFLFFFIEIEEVVSVYNPVLVTNFINTWVILKERIKNSANIFANAKWAGTREDEKKETEKRKEE